MSSSSPATGPSAAKKAPKGPVSPSSEDAVAADTKADGAAPRRGRRGRVPSRKLQAANNKEGAVKTVSPAIRALVNKLYEVWPANRQLRADIARDLISSKDNGSKLLASRGIIYFDKNASYHLAALERQRKIHKKQQVQHRFAFGWGHRLINGIFLVFVDRAEKLTQKLNYSDWASFVATVVYDLLHQEDTLTLRIVGLFVDPLSGWAPLPFRLMYALKRALLAPEDKSLSKSIMNHMERVVNVDGIKEDDDSMLTGLVTLLLCDADEARAVLGGSRATAAKAKVKPEVLIEPKGDPGKMVFGELPADDQDDEPASLDEVKGRGDTGSGAGRGKKQSLDEDGDYKPYKIAKGKVSRGRKALKGGTSAKTSTPSPALPPAPQQSRRNRPVRSSKASAVASSKKAVPNRR